MSKRRIPPFVMKGGKVTPARVKVSADVAYTVDELHQLGKQWLAELNAKGHHRLSLPLTISLFLTWLRKQED